MNNGSLYLIRALTNMHVGRGDLTFNIVDNEVQRDVVTNLPMIFSSSLKGALREFFENNVSDKDIISYIFGDEGIKTAGNYKFFSAHILSIPARSNKKPYFMATCKSVLKEFLNYIDFLDLKQEYKDLEAKLLEFIKIDVHKDNPVIFEKLDNVSIENYSAVYKEFKDIKYIETLLGENIALFDDEVFKENIAKELPVVARNHLENGISKNLWYEEIVPRESRFFFAVLKDEKYSEEFDSYITKNIIQIGANASIGYGYTKINKLEGVKNE